MLYYQTIHLPINFIIKMKKLLSIAFLACSMQIAVAQQLTTPQPSPLQTVKQAFGVGNIELSYSRPSLKGRVAFGELEPYDKVWRTGANGATTLTFSDDVTIGDKLVKAGKYGFLAIPGAESFILIITKDVNVNSRTLYKQENDVVRVTVPVKKMADKVETFTIQFGNITNTSIHLEMMWDNTSVALPITTNTDAKVMAQIDNVFNKDTKPYFAAASYYYEAGKDLKQAQTWVDAALANKANEKAYWMYLLKARIHAKLGDKVGAKAMCDKTITLATEAQNDGYVKMASDLKATL
jgi:hypothetical protein